MIDTVVFDLGNVLIPWDVRWLLKEYFESTPAADTFMKEIDFFTWHARQDAGYPVSKAIEEHCARHPQHAKPIRALYEHWHLTMGPAIEGSVALLRELKAAGIRTYALSNFSAELFYRSKPRFDFWDGFDGIVLSGEEGMNKPDAKIYRILFERHDIDPAHAVFIDDSLPNVEASRALGMCAIHFQGAEAARVDLRALGLPV